jgi:hypothetical protein
MPPVVLSIEVDDHGAIRAVQQLGSEVQRTGQQVGQSAQPLAQVAQAATQVKSGFLATAQSALAFGAAVGGVQLGESALAGVFQAVVGQVGAFDAAMANVNTLGIKSADVQAQLRTQLLQLPPALGDATTLAKGLYEVLSSGIEPAKAVAFLETSANLAKAGLGQLDTATVALTKTMQAFRIPTEDASKVADLLFKSVEIGQGSLQNFAQSFPQVTQISASLGLSFLDTANALATLTQTFKSAPFKFQLTVSRKPLVMVGW